MSKSPGHWHEKTQNIQSILEKLKKEIENHIRTKEEILKKFI